MYSVQKVCELLPDGGNKNRMMPVGDHSVDRKGYLIGGCTMNVTVYSTPTCPWCVRVKEYLNYKEVKFKEVNVAADRDAAMEMVRKSGQRGVPVVEIDGKIIVGFNQPEIDKLLAGG